MNGAVSIKGFHFLLGIVLAIGILYCGIWIALKIEHLAPVILILLGTFFLAIFLSLTEKRKYIGYGMCTGFLILIIFGYIQLKTIQYP